MNRSSHALYLKYRPLQGSHGKNGVDYFRIMFGLDPSPAGKGEVCYVAIKLSAASFDAYLSHQNISWKNHQKPKEQYLLWNDR